ncbi:ferrochelatase [Janibacter sp. GXQ6167]|uniref:ferrochelatase n=1 Tax=Janibacter sp. GXQ6167 TaxID=3240791 RepID=UPI003523224C
MATPSMAPYDAVLLLSFGGPEHQDEVVPFLRRVTAGKGIPDERLEEVGAHYRLFGGRSPINDQNRALLAALRVELDARGITTPLRWGNRHSAPFVADALREAKEAGEERVLALRTSAWRSYSSCRQYREDLEGAAVEGVSVDVVRPYGEHPGFAATNAALVRDALALARDANPDLRDLRVLYVTHSIPDAMDLTSGPPDEERAYSRGHLALAAAITDDVQAELGLEVATELVYCSRSGPPAMPWLEPDVADRIRELPAEGVRRVIVVPIGFVSDHMEVVYDLDVDAAEAAESAQIEMVRIPTVGIDQRFVAGLVDLLLEQAARARGESPDAPAWGPLRATPSPCPAGCCPNLRR